MKVETIDWDFIKDYFEKSGSINAPNENVHYPICKIKFNSNELFTRIKEYINLPITLEGEIGYIHHNSALDFMSKIYDDCNNYHSNNYKKYLVWRNFIPSLSSRHSNVFKWEKANPKAVAPFKTRASDSGYDLVILEKVKTIGNVELWDTGVKIYPEYGWYFDLAPRSSIIKSGYILANSFGVIDRTYTGNIMVPFIKIDPNAKCLVGGERLVQIIPRPVIHAKFEEVVGQKVDTQRGSGGFGSTG